MADSDTESLLLKLSDSSEDEGPVADVGQKLVGPVEEAPSGRKENVDSKENLDSSVTIKIFECYI